MPSRNESVSYVFQIKKRKSKKENRKKLEKEEKQTSNPNDRKYATSTINRITKRAIWRSGSEYLPRYDILIKLLNHIFPCESRNNSFSGKERARQWRLLRLRVAYILTKRCQMSTFAWNMFFPFYTLCHSRDCNFVTSGMPARTCDKSARA